MFQYTNFVDETNQRPKSPKDRPRGTSIPKPIKGMEKRTTGSFSVAASKPKTTTRSATPGRDKPISERYTNSSYNRLPSPKGRFQALSSPLTDNRPPSVARKASTTEQRRTRPSGILCDRVQSFIGQPKRGSQINTSTVKQSCSDILNRRRTLETECQRGNSQGEVDVRVRPKTSHCSRTESNIENRFLNRVETVLSRAVLQQGKIDETNIANIINSMRSSLHQEPDLDNEVMSEIDVALKLSRTTVNEIDLTEENAVEKNVKQVPGIIRKENLNSKPERKPYMKIYNQTDSSSKHVMNKNVPDGDEETIISIDFPDSAIPNFPPIKKNVRKYIAKTKSECTASKQNLQTDTPERSGLQQQFEVGDVRMKESRFWNPSEAEQIQSYVESLLQNIKNKVQSENSAAETEGEVDCQGTVCRSFCVCKVCVTKKSQSKSVLKVEGGKTKPLESSIGRIVRNCENKPPIKQGPGSRMRVLKPLSKGVVAAAPCRVIRNTNPNFKPEESSLNTSLHVTPVNKTTSYTVVTDAATGPEEGDDMYLRRRIRKAPSRRGSAKMK